MDLSKTMLIGNMVRDPESRTMPNGQRIVRFCLATNYAWKDANTKVKKESVDFHNLVAWGRLGDILIQYVKKGSKLYVEGRLTNRQYITKDGMKKVTTEIVADNFIMLGHRTKVNGDVSDKFIHEDVDTDEAEGNE